VTRTPIRMKLAVALAVPSLALLVITVVELRSLGREVDQIADQTDLARAATGPAGLITLLQDERSWAAGELVGRSDLLSVAAEGYDESRQLTDEAIAGFETELARRGEAAVTAFGPAIDGLGALDQIRADIDANRSTPAHGTLDNADFSSDVYGRYTELVTPFFDATDRVLLSIDDPDLRRGTELVNLSSEQVTIFSELARMIVVVPVSQSGFDTTAEIRAGVQLVERWNAGNAELLGVEAPYDAVVAEHFPAEIASELASMADRAIDGEEVPFDQLMVPLRTPGAGGLVDFRIAMADRLDETADRIHGEARSRERLFLALTGVTLAATLLLSWVVSRSITGPLRSLTRQAKEMADERLPAAVLDVLHTPLGHDVRVPHAPPVQVETRDEVEDVAAALNTVQDTALTLAVEQAVLRRNIADSFVNLGRRNQHLLRRQLDFITQLERDETEPTALANLFRLDHLATRMRRNAESLLVLAGVDPPRQWAAAVGLTDVVRAAIGEVEDFQRVVMRDVEPTTVVGSAAADLAHLLAELIENALVFSAADRPVAVRGRRRGDGGYGLAVTDAGRGMDDEALEAANRRLAGAESFTVAPSRYLGHYVAGNLASRHGIDVRLVRNPAGAGITAAVDLPPALVTTPAVGPAAPGTPRPSHAAVPPASPA